MLDYDDCNSNYTQSMEKKKLSLDSCYNKN